MSPHRLPSRKETMAAAILAGLGGLWLLMPAVPQPAGYHDFADRRSLLGIANAADVLSNIAFVAVGLVGLARLRRTQRPLRAPVRAGLHVFFVGLLLTGFASAYYHASPSDATLAVDRLAMTVAFAGVFGALLGERISERFGWASLALVLVVGPASVLYWRASGDVSLYAVVQFGGMVAILLLLALAPRSADALPWWALMAWYALAKMAEAGDALVWQATRETLAGHALKHVAAAAGGLAIANALRDRPARQRRGREPGRGVSSPPHDAASHRAER